LRWLLTIFIIILSVFVYIHYLNPHYVDLYYVYDKFYRLSLSLVIFLSFILGIFITFVIFLVRDIKETINNWTTNREDIKRRKSSELYYKGIDSFLNGDFESANDSFNKAINRDPNNINSYLKLADIYMNEEEYNEAVKILYKGKIVDQDNIEISLKLAKVFQKLKDYETSIDTLKKIKNGNHRILKELLKCYIELPDWEKAYHVEKELININDGRERNLLLGINFESEIFEILIKSKSFFYF